MSETDVRFSENVPTPETNARPYVEAAAGKRHTVRGELSLSKFEDGQVLPVEICRTLPYLIFGMPLIETDKTFVVIGRELAFSLSGFSKAPNTSSGKLFRFSSHPSFFLFRTNNVLRRIALYCYTHPVFELTILLTICANAVYMSTNSVCPVAEYTFLAIYTVEAITKWLARGMAYHPYTYLTDAWNWLDLLVLLSSYAALGVQLSGIIEGGLNLQALRTFRLLRMITILPGLQSIVKALLLSIRNIFGVMAFVSFFLVVFALFGIELFQGDLRNKCVASMPSSDNTTSWINWTSDSANWALDDQGNFKICGNVSGAQRCPFGYQCFLVPSSINPLYGYLNFDDFLIAVLTVISVVTGDYWEEVFRVVLSTSGPWSSLYFFIVVIFGAFYLMNLILSVVALSYTPETEDDSTSPPEIPPETTNDAAVDDVSNIVATTAVDDTKHQGEVISEVVSSNFLTRPRASTTVVQAFEMAARSGKNQKVWTRIRKRARRYFRQTRVNVDRFRQLIRRAIDSSAFDAIITAVIVVNTIAMAIVHYGMPHIISDITDIINSICAIVFGIEALLKIMAFGRDYFKNRWNLLDFFVVIGSILDAVATYALQSATSVNATSVRLLRLLRILKLAQSWRTMRLLLEIIFHAITSLANLTVILACVSFIFALIGMDLFSGTYTTQVFGENLPRWNFDDLLRSLLTVFRILCRDSVEPMIACFRANGLAMCLPVFLGTLIIGTFIVLNLFLALLLMAFSSDDLKSSSSQIDSDTQKEPSPALLDRVKNFIVACRPCKKRNEPAAPPRDEESGGVEPHRCCSTTCIRQKISLARERVRTICEHKAFETAVLVLIFVSSVSLCLNDVYLQEGSLLEIALTVLDNLFLALFTTEFLLKLFAYGFGTCFTQFWTILDFIVIATGFIDLGLTQTKSAKSNLLALRCLRCIRCLRPLRAISRWQGMRIVVDALIHTIPGIGNVLLVVVVFWLVFAIVGVQFFAGKFARCIDIESGDRLPVALIANRKACEDFPNGTAPTRRWMNPTIHFDNVIVAYLGLLQIATFESWTDILEAGVDVPDNVGDQPSRERSFSYAIYFIVFIVFGSFFLLNLFIGVIVDSFNELKKELEVSAVELLLTESQRNYYRMVKKVGKRKPRRLAPEPKWKILAVWFKLATSPILEGVMAGVIVASCVSMATEHFGQSEMFTYVQEKFNLAFTVIFTVEAIVKIVGLRVHYFREAWNIFDLTLVVWSLATISLDENSVVKNMRTSSLLRALRVLRIGRLVRLVRSMSSVRALIFSLLSSLPALFNVGCLLSLMIFIYSICGMILFGHVRHQGAITDVVNFETFGSSFLLLFRLSTLAGWDGVLTALSIQTVHVERGGCDPDFWVSPVTGNRTAALGGDCGSPIIAAIFMATFIIVSNFVLTNIFVAIILENLDAATRTSNDADNDNGVVNITDDDIDSFFITWAVFDPLATQYIRLCDLSDLLNELEGPFHFKKPNSCIIALLDLPILNDGVTGEEMLHCADVLMALVHHHSVGAVSRQLGNRDSMTSDRLKADTVEDAVRRVALAAELEEEVFVNWKSSARRNAEIRVSSTLERRRIEINIIRIQRAWRRYLLQKMKKKTKTTSAWS